MPISIVIVNWNTATLLRNCLRSIDSASLGYAQNVIVVDNGSNDGSVEMVRSEFPNVILIPTGNNMGFARGNNLARKHIKTDLVLFLNPDTEVMVDTLSLLEGFMQNNPKVGAVGCKMKSPAGSDAPDAEAHALGLQWYPTPFKELLGFLFLTEKTMRLAKWFLPYQDPNRSGYVIKLYGGCLLVRLNVLDHVDWFDERFFMYAEDGDLCRRIAMAGWKLYYAADIEIIHAVAGSSKKAGNHFAAIMKCESMCKLMEKYYGKRGWLLYKGTVFAGAFIRLAALTTFRMAVSLVNSTKSSRYLEGTEKYRLMIGWALGIVEAKVPVGISRRSL